MAHIINQLLERGSVSRADKETRLMQDSEEAFFKAFGFSLPPKERRSVLSTKAELSLTIQDVSQLHKAGLLQCPAFEEPYLRLRKRDLGIALIETLLIPSIFLLIAIVINFEAVAHNNSSIPVLLSTGALYLCGFSLFYFMIQQKIRPFFILRRARLEFGERFPAKR